jgi:hypothetical protein
MSIGEIEPYVAPNLRQETPVPGRGADATKDSRGDLHSPLISGCGRNTDTIPGIAEPEVNPTDPGRGTELTSGQHSNSDPSLVFGFGRDTDAIPGMVPAAGPGRGTESSDGQHFTSDFALRDDGQTSGDDSAEAGMFRYRGGNPYDILQTIAEDTVRRVDPWEELTFGGILSQADQPKYKVKCIVDTACGQGYLLVPPHIQNPFVTKEINDSLCAVNGTKTQVNEEVSLLMTIGNRCRVVNLRVLATPIDEELSVLCGRYILELFDIATQGGRSVTMGCTSLRDARNDTVRRCIESGSLQEDISDFTTTDVLPRPNDRVIPHTRPSDIANVEKLLDGLVRSGVQPLPRCAGRMEFRSLRPGEAQDTPEQTHTFELCLDHRPFEDSHVRLYARAVFNKLSLEHRHSFRSQITEYEQNGWWVRAPQSVCRDQSAGPPANVFGIVQKDKFRLVCDLKPFNRHYPSTTTEQPHIPYSLALLRIQPGGTIIVGDCSSAFYRVRLARPLWLHCGEEGDYLCYRMAFGLSMGPEGLQQSLGVLWRLFGLTSAGVGSLYVDDFWMRLPDEKKEDYHRCLYLLLRCGFDVPNKKFQVLSKENRELKVFGRVIEYVEEAGNFSTSTRCCDYRQEVLDLASRENFSRSDVFSIAGALAYDPLKTHVDAKICGDLLRSVSGRMSPEWHTKLAPSGMEAALLSSLLAWSRDLVRERRDCSHILECWKKDHFDFVINTDASHTGGGAVIRCRGQANPLYTDAWVWNSGHMSYHCNRLEAMALFRTLRVTNHFIEFLISAQFGGQKPAISVTVLTDSTTALAWALKGHNSHGYESRSIDRLCDGLRDEILHMRKRCIVNLGHTSGTVNVEADNLSRILDREVDGRKLGDLLRLRAKRKRTPSAAAIEAVRRTIGSRMCLAESVTGESYDIFQAIETFGTLRLLISAWRNRGTRFQSVDTSSSSPPSDRADPDYDDFGTNRDLFCKSAQGSAVSIPSSNPFYKSNSGVVEHHRTKFDGSVEISAYIPKSCPLIQRCVVRTFHRISNHRGSRYTASCIKYFFLEGRQAAIRSTLQSCLRCAVKNARVQWSLSTCTFPRELNLPTFARICIDHLHLDRVVVLSIMCIDTGVISLIYGKAVTVEHSIEALQVLINRYGVTLNRIHCDQASCFTSPRFVSALAKVGQNPEISFTVPNAPYTNPVERLHAEVRSIIRTSKFKQRCMIEEQNVQETLDVISNIINQRPIGVCEDGSEILTPAFMAWGSRWSTKKLPDLRKYFYEHCFDTLRRSHLTSKQRRGSVVIGARALVYDPSASKITPPFSLCKIIDIVGNYIVVKTNDGKTRKVGSAQLAPLSIPAHPDFVTPRPTDVSRVGARIGMTYVEGGAPREFFGQVVGDHCDQVEIQWDPRDETTWPNELVSWGACRVLSETRL